MIKFKNTPIVVALITMLLMLGYFAITNGGEPQLQQPPVGAVVVVKPDLVVTGICFKKCGCQCGRTNFGTHRLVRYSEDLRVYIKNQGGAASVPCKLRIELYDNVGCRKAVITKDVGALGPGKSACIEEKGEYLWRLADGIKATVDSTNVVNESNEGNNILTVRECTQCAPDPACGDLI